MNDTQRFAITVVFCLIVGQLSATEPPWQSVPGTHTSGTDERFSTNQAVLKIMEQRQVPARASGMIDVSHVREGVLLKIGDPVVQIDDKLAKLDVDRLTREKEKADKEASTRVELEYTRRSMEVAQAELNRAELSNQRQPGSVSRSEIDQLNLMVQRAAAEEEKTEFQIELRKMEAQIKQLELSIGQEKLRQHQTESPIDGMVVEVFKQQGEWVEASEPICRMVRLDKLKTEVKVPAAIALDNLLGSSAEFIPDLPALQDRKFQAKVVFIDPEAISVDATVKVWVEIENPDLSLVAGLTGRLVIH